jgi:uncharacterized protein (DUF433 family)
MPAKERKVYGKYVVADPKICHGKLTFAGTRVFVADVLEMVAEGRPWEEISREWHGLRLEAIAEAVMLARDAFVRFADDFSPAPFLRSGRPALRT